MSLFDIERLTESLEAAGKTTAVELARKLQDEVLSDIEKFTPEAREALVEEGYVFYKLYGESLYTLEERGNKFRLNAHEGRGINHETSKAREVAIKPDMLFLEATRGKTLQEQERIVANLSNELSDRIPGVKMVIGTTNENAGLAFAHLKATGQRLFGEKHNCDYAASSSCGVVVGDFNDDGLTVTYRTDYVRPGEILVAPLIVPAA